MSFSETLRKPKFWFIAVPVVVLLAVVVGPFVYFNFIQEDAPEPLGFEDITTTTAGGSTATTSASTSAGDGTIAGSWELAGGSTAGYRATEVLFGQTNEAAGRTEDVTGTLEIDGTTATAVSIEVDLTTLSSDESIRDGQVQSRILELRAHRADRLRHRARRPGGDHGQRHRRPDRPRRDPGRHRRDGRPQERRRHRGDRDHPGDLVGLRDQRPQRWPGPGRGQRRDRVRPQLLEELTKAPRPSGAHWPP